MNQPLAAGPQSTTAVPATQDDAAAVAECVAAAYRPWIAVIGTTPGPMNQDYGAVIAEAQVLVTKDESGVLSVLVLRTTGEGFLLENIAVHPRARGRGLGSNLLALAEREAVAQGHSTIYLYTHERMTTNISIYAARGYTEYTRRSEDGFPRVFMRKALLAQ